MSRGAPPGAAQNTLKNGAHDQNRTDDPFLTMEVLYRLSYAGIRKNCFIMERETRLELATLSLEG